MQVLHSKDNVYIIYSCINYLTCRDIVLRHKGSDHIHKVAVILYTGGVSGDPKPVEITVRGLVYATICFR